MECVDRSRSSTKSERRNDENSQNGFKRNNYSLSHASNNSPFRKDVQRNKSFARARFDDDDHYYKDFGASRFGPDDNHCNGNGRFMPDRSSYRSPEKQSHSHSRRPLSPRSRRPLSPLREESNFNPKERVISHRSHYRRSRSNSGGARSRSRDRDNSKFSQAVTVSAKVGEDEEQVKDCSLGDPEHVIKHPLQNSWAMWFFKNDKSRDWKDNLRVITTFETVEDFWGLYNHTLPASRLPSGCDYSVFKAGIQPMWEDAQNKKGGRWLINLNKSQRQTHLDDFWLETLLCLIGEGFDEHSEDICGATVNIRTKGDKLGLWTRDAQKIEATKKIGVKLKESLNVPSKIVIGFQAHSDTAGKAGSTVKNRFTV